MIKTEYYPFKGGLNLESPAMSLGRGELIGCQNYECAQSGGYRRIDGYERFDGHHLASSSVYHILDFTAGTNQPNVNQEVTGAASGAKGIILAVVVDSGAFATNDAVGHFAIHIESGSFLDAEQINYYVSDAFTSGFSQGFK